MRRTPGLKFESDWKLQEFKHINFLMSIVIIGLLFDRRVRCQLTRVWKQQGQCHLMHNVEQSSLDGFVDCILLIHIDTSSKAVASRVVSSTALKLTRLMTYSLVSIQVRGPNRWVQLTIYHKPIRFAKGGTCFYQLIGGWESLKKGKVTNLDLWL